ncbi:MAG: NADH-quinone oxidoreductase subunit J [Alphaproteobacteria bacterium]|nr:MAG: NADH-quinone oxidoreductase subunit J [Alphaproteobacteria bacterium]
MSWTAFAFYLFGFFTVLAASLVVLARNPVHSVLFLIFAFFNAAALFLLAGAEFLALLLVVVYVGAVAVLFLFVVMMLDIDFVRLREGFARYLPIGLLVGLAFLAELVTVATSASVLPGAPDSLMLPLARFAGLDNTTALGTVLYTDYVYPFQMAGVILLVAMIGAIVLTLRHRPDARRQKISEQVRRDPRKAVKLVDLKPGAGLQEVDAPAAEKERA